jgi:Tfp pilus assembly protein PilX
MKFLRPLKEERGIALALALGIMFILGISATTAIYYTSAAQRSASYSKGKQLALTLAEAGLNNTMSVLSLPTNNALHQDIMPKCTGNAQSNWNKSTYDGGYVIWCGDLDISQSAWNVTAIGTVRNPTGGTTVSAVTHKITAYIPVSPTVTQPLNNPVWNYLFATRTGNTCDQTVSNNVSGDSRFYVNGNLCVGNNAILAPTVLVVRGSLDLSNGTGVGAATSMSTRIETYIGGSCRYSNSGSWGFPCSGNQDARHIYAKMNPPNYVVGVNGTPPAIPVPNSDFAGWYENSIPGPRVPCSSVSGTPPTFDTLSAGQQAFVRDNNVLVQNLTPSSSYTCRVGPSSNPDGELSWNATTKTLTVRGTIYIDGSAKIDNGALNQYNGQATIYLSGTFYLDGKLCGGVSGSTCDYNAWNPNTEMLTIVANGNGGNGVNTGDSIFVANNGVFEGALYGTNNITIGNNGTSDGPMVASQIIISNNVYTHGFTNITTVPAGMPDNPAVYAQPNAPQRFSG